MKAKRIASLVLILLAAMSATAMAANWEWVYSNDDNSFYYESNSIMYKVYDEFESKIHDSPIDKGEIRYWEKRTFTPQSAEKLSKKLDAEHLSKTAYAIIYVKITKTPEEITYYDCVYYDEEGRVIENFPGRPGGYSVKVVPGTVGEIVYKHLIEYCKVHDEEITARSKGEK